jgi:3-oxoacyl-[acyl-carrier-protein] synthase II (EC 2.3.1.41)
MKERRVVVTGLGILSPVGNSIEESWSNILNGKSGVANINYFDTSAFDTHFAASLQNFNPLDYLDKKK